METLLLALIIINIAIMKIVGMISLQVMVTTKQGMGVLHIVSKESNQILRLVIVNVGIVVVANTN